MQEHTIRFFKSVAACFALLLVAPFRVFADAPRDGFIAWAKSHATPIASLDLTADSADLRPLVPMIGAAHVVALGEPAHGTHEPLAFRNRLFRFLVEEQGFTAIAIEAGFTETQATADYVAGGSVVATQIGQLRSRENEELVSWMREYNATPSHPRKVHLYGMNLSLGGLGNAFPTARPINEALSFVGKVDESSAAKLQARFAPYLGRLPGPGDQPPSFSALDHDALTGAIDDLLGWFDRQRVAFPDALAAGAFERAHRDAVIAQQADRMFRATTTEMRPGELPRDAWIAAGLRDSAMADNVRWILDQEGAQGRVLVFAHDAHVKNAATEGGVWAAFDQPAPAMGQYLRRGLGADLVIIGMSAGKSMAPAPSIAPPLESLDSALLEVAQPSYLLDLRTARDGAAAAWLGEPQALTANLTTFLIVRPAKAFDVLFFTEKLTSSHTDGTP